MRDKHFSICLKCNKQFAHGMGRFWDKNNPNGRYYIRPSDEFMKHLAACFVYKDQPIIKSIGV